MEPDKNLDILERQLKTLGQRTRIDILKKLEIFPNPLSYSILQKEVLGSNPNSVNFSFHLKALKKNNLINSTDEGYSLSTLGNQILKRILSIEQLLNDQNKTIMIRTSKYSKEPFNPKKIEECLIKEGNLDTFLAKQIAQEVEERLSKTNIEYLTAPLMREYINGVLLENGLEEVRHKLTRLGTPPFEVTKLLSNGDLSPSEIIHRLGSDVSEQYLLLNIFPKNLADLYLSGEIALLNLNYWNLRPLSFYIDSNKLLNNPKIKDDNFNYSILNFIQTINKIITYISEDIILGRFDSTVLSTKEYGKLIQYVLPQISENKNGFKSHLSLDIASFQNSHKFFESLQGIHGNIPRIILDFSTLIDGDFDSLNTVISSNSINQFTFYNGQNINLVNSTNINIKKFERESNINKSKVILDKILINLYLIALESNQNDDIFIDLLKNKIYSVFELYKLKIECMKKRTNQSKKWRYLFSDILNLDFKEWTNESLKSISFYGLNEAVKYHCGIEMDRLETSETFAKNLLLMMKDLINEKNVDEHERYILSQPHYDNYLKCKIQNQDFPFKSYSPNLIREDSMLDLNKQIEIFRKFENIIDGGSNFYVGTKFFEKPIENFEKLANSDLKAFSIARK